ncbi:hypothetical protein C8A05DRAFT_30176 [Staphylotrichum tortipilum]|uniref:Uncharacterized protein n=1 Tax=Staphylotrichum tortipilum TaxID=2831512 RepID=A0AAN6RWY5_9PEZI|nr:hypothetical protein C8A05DRAFT_30176 [Staphylotrichum longicolle]
MVLCEMDPVCGASVARITSSRWLLSSLMVVEKVDGPEAKPPGAIAHWQDGDGIFCLRNRSTDDSELAAGDSKADGIHEAGISAAVWRLGQNTIVKVHSWIEDVEMEAEKIPFAAEKAPEVPVPDVLYAWVDHDLNRSFLIMKRVEGEILEKALPKLSPLQRAQIANDVAQFCVNLAVNISTRL